MKKAVFGFGIVVVAVIAMFLGDSEPQKNPAQKECAPSFNGKFNPQNPSCMRGWGRFVCEGDKVENLPNALKYLLPEEINEEAKIIWLKTSMSSIRISIASLDGRRHHFLISSYDAGRKAWEKNYASKKVCEKDEYHLFRWSRFPNQYFNAEGWVGENLAHMRKKICAEDHLRHRFREEPRLNCPALSK